jgi:hypothetical protein
MTMKKSSSWESSDEGVTLTLIYSSKICTNSDLNIQDDAKFDAHLEYVIIFINICFYNDKMSKIPYAAFAFQGYI